MWFDTFFNFFIIVMSFNSACSSWTSALILRQVGRSKIEAGGGRKRERELHWIILISNFSNFIVKKSDKLNHLVWIYKNTVSLNASMDIMYCTCYNHFYFGENMCYDKFFYFFLIAISYISPCSSWTSALILWQVSQSEIEAGGGRERKRESFTE